MLRSLYNALWYPAIPLALLAAGGRDPLIRRQRLGYLQLPSDGTLTETRVWLHAASVGEIEAVRPMALGLMREMPHLDLVVTTMTASGRDAARRRIPRARACAMAPLDCPSVVRRFVRAMRPKLVMIAETELWPNYFFVSHAAGAKIAILNGRISVRSLERYQWAHELFAQALGLADLVLAQSEDDARRYVWLGAARERVMTTGNLKYDLDAAGAGLPLRPELEAFAAGKPILIAGSTSRGEEQLALYAYRELLPSFPDLALVVAPRHPGRVGEVERTLRAAGLPYLKASTIRAAEGAPMLGVMLLDTMGELRPLYRRAAVAFVGGSIAPGRGGQNLAEPAAASVPVLFGPFHESQEPLASALLAEGGGRQVHDATELARVCAELLGDESARAAAGRSARVSLERLAGNLQPGLLRLKALAADLEAR